MFREDLLSAQNSHSDGRLVQLSEEVLISRAEDIDFLVGKQKKAVSDGSLEAIKWLALLLMTGDHINKYLFNGNLPFLYEVSRMTLPLFVFVLSCNLAREGAQKSRVYGRVMKRLMIAGLLATPPFIAMNPMQTGWWPLNIMFALLVSTVVLYLMERGSVGGRHYYVIAAAIFIVGGSLVEFWWWVPVFCLSFWQYYRQPKWWVAPVILFACFSLWLVNLNWWVFAALPVIWIGAHIDLQVPRLRWLFYVYYPAHLYALWIIRFVMSKYGYLSF